MQKFWSGVFAVVLGAVVGVLVSKEIATHFGFGFSAVFLGAIVGAVFGGASAWAGADVPNFVNGVSRAWREIVSYRPSLRYGVENMMGNMRIFSVAMGAISIVPGIFMAIGGGNGLVPIAVEWGRYVNYIYFTIGLATVCTAVSFMSGFFFHVREAIWEVSPSDWKEISIFVNPVTTPLVVMLGLTAIIFALVVMFNFLWHHWAISLLLATTGLVWSLRKFISTAYLYIHTYQRRCAFVGAVAGVLVASFTGHSALVGAVVGVFTFTAEYQLATRVFPRVVPE